MNNIFYEFLEKNQLQGLEENLSTLDVFNEEKGAGALLQILPKNDNYEIISAEYMSCMITHNKKRYTIYMLKSGRNFFIIPRGVVTINAEQQKTIDEILNLLKTKAGISDFKTLPAKSIKVGDKTLTSPIYTFLRGDITKFYKILRNFIINKRPGVSTDTLTRGSKPGSMNTGEKGNSDPNNDNVSPNNKTGENNSTAVKGTSSRKAAVDAAEKELKMQQFGKNVAMAKAKRAEIIKGSKNDIFTKMSKQDYDAITAVYDLVREIHSANYNDDIQKNNFSLKKDMSKYRKNTKLDAKLASIVRVIPKLKTIATRYNIGQGKDDPNKVNELLKLYGNVIQGRDNDPSVSWFYENYVNNHFTMKRIFNS